MLVVAIVGMAGAGKSEVANIFESQGYTRIRFGDVTDGELKKAGLAVSEANERAMRESLREKYGMDAYAKLNVPTIDSALGTSPVVVDGLYSWEEYVFLRDYYKTDLRVVAVWASPATRCARLANRSVRPLTREETYSRDTAEIQNLNKGGPIALADYTILNDKSLIDLERKSKEIIDVLKEQP
ncbi:MAG: AAA family ATPase [Dehalococcoidia bacterium]|nr:AAA family ATPase [Dehalococcoidia bacterium]